MRHNVRRSKRQYWKQPVTWVMLIFSGFILNLGIAIVTIHHHLKFDDGSSDGDASLFQQFASQALARVSPYSDGVIHSGGQHKSSLEQPERFLWHRLLQESVNDSRSTQCMKQAAGNASQTSNRDAISLPPMGFHRRIQFLFNHSIGWNTTATEMESSDMHKCYLPPHMSCIPTQYSVVVLSEATNLRRLFLNLLSLQSYPSVADVSLIMPSGEVLHALQGDAKYGRRILDWRNHGILKQVLYEPTLWESLQMLQPSEAALLVLNGDIERKDWNGTHLLTNFRIWRQHARSLVTSSWYMEDPSSSSTPCTIHRWGLHGTFLHRNWLCFLQHPMVAPLKEYLQNLTTSQQSVSEHWNSILSGLSFLFNSLGDGHVVTEGASKRKPLLFNSRRDAWEAEDAIQNTLYAYFGCKCPSITLLPLRSNSTCIQDHQGAPEAIVGTKY